MNPICLGWDPGVSILEDTPPPPGVGKKIGLRGKKSLLWKQNRRNCNFLACGTGTDCN
jgi:hypothetical protein